MIKIPNGPSGIRETLKYMRGFVQGGKKSITVRTTALNIVAGLNQKDWSGEIRRLHAFVRDSIRYVKDINGVETLQSPDKTLEFGQGDCDDKSILLASLLESIGHPTRFVAIGFRPNQYCHVYVETKIGTKWIPLETTEPVKVGWQPLGIVSKLYAHNGRR